MGCGTSKNQFQNDDNVVIRSREDSAPGKDERVYRENVRVENDAVYTGEFVGGKKDGKGTQKCMFVLRS